MGFSLTLAVAVLLAEVLALSALRVGGRWVGRPALGPLGRVLARGKTRSLQRWPLTRLRAAVERGDAPPVRGIVTALIAAKSAASFVGGIVVLPWLPLAALLVPAIVAAHDPGNAALQGWARRVGGWQVTSHVLAAAPGFAVVWHGPLQGRPLRETLAAHALPIVVLLVLSALCAAVAGRIEADGLLAHRPLSRKPAPSAGR